MKLNIVTLLVAGSTTATKLQRHSHHQHEPKMYAQLNQWDGDIAGLVDVNSYMQPMMTSLADQNMHNTDQYTMSAEKYNAIQEKIHAKEESEKLIREQQMAAAKSKSEENKQSILE